MAVGERPAARTAWVGGLAVLLVAIALMPVLPLDTGAPSGAGSGGDGRVLDTRSGAFLENRGQLANAQVRFYGSSGALAVGFGAGSVSYVIREAAPPGGGSAPAEPVPPSRGVLVRATFEGANPVAPEGIDPLPHPTHFFLGNDPSRWVSGVRSVREVRYRGVWDGIDVAYRADGGLKSEFLVRPGADVGAIRIAYEGIDGLSVDAGGRLALRTGLGDLYEDAPYAYQGTEEVACRFVPRDPASAGFTCEGWNRSEPFVIDPLVYATFLGGGSGEGGTSVTVDADGYAYVVGDAYSPDFPVTPGAFRSRTPGPDNDVFVAKFDRTGSALEYAAILGGGDADTASSVAVSPTGEAYVAGGTSSADFPVTPGAFQTDLRERVDAFVARLSADGSALVYSTFLGGWGGSDWAHALALRPDGRACATGEASRYFPVTPGAYDTDRNGTSRKSFVACLEPDGGALWWATFLRDTIAYGIALDPDGNAYVAGLAGATDFPVTPGAYDTTPNGKTDAFVAKLSGDGSALVYGTYLGGSSIEDFVPTDDLGPSIAVDADGSAYVAGETYSTDFPTTPGAFNRTHSGTFVETFLVKFDPTGSTMVYGTFLGKGWAPSVAVDGRGRACVAGVTRYADFPTTPDGFDPTHNGVEDAFLVQMNEDGTDLLYGTFLGGSAVDWALGLAVDRAGDAYVVGFTDGRFGFPVTHGAYDTTFNGGAHDVFVAKFDLPGADLEADIDFDPDTLNPRSGGRWVTVYIELPAGRDPRDIDAATVRMNGVLAPVLDPKYGFVTDPAGYIVDHDGDGVWERMVKFDREHVAAILPVGVHPVRITGRLADGIAFSGLSDPIRVLP